MSLRDDLLRERLAAYARLRGGYPIPLAGAIYWAGLGIAGYSLPPNRWTFGAFILSGSIFPLALLLAKIFRNDLMRDKTAEAMCFFQPSLPCCSSGRSRSRLSGAPCSLCH